MTLGTKHLHGWKAALTLVAAPLSLAASRSPQPAPAPPEPTDTIVSAPETTVTTTLPVLSVVTSAPPGLPPITVALPAETTPAPPETTTTPLQNEVPAEPVPVPALPEKVARLLDISVAQEGKPYVYAAAGPDQFDCSGLVWYSLDQAGVELPRLSAEGDRQRFQDYPVAQEDLQPGDLLFYWSPNDRGIPKGHATHVEIYTGFGYAMGTDNEKEGARLEPVNWKTFIGAERVPDLYT